MFKRLLLCLIIFFVAGCARGPFTTPVSLDQLTLKITVKGNITGNGTGYYYFVFNAQGNFLSSDISTWTDYIRFGDDGFKIAHRNGTNPRDFTDLVTFTKGSISNDNKTIIITLNLSELTSTPTITNMLVNFVTADKNGIYYEVVDALGYGKGNGTESITINATQAITLATPDPSGDLDIASLIYPLPPGFVNDNFDITSTSIEFRP